MQVQDEKWLHKAVNLLAPVDTYQRVMGILVDRCKPLNRIDESQLRRILSQVADTLYVHYRHVLLAERPDNSADRETKVRHNLSVKHLRIEFRRVKHQIYSEFREW